MANRFSFAIPLEPGERNSVKIARALENFNNIGRWLDERDVRKAIGEGQTPTSDLDPNAGFGAEMGRVATAQRDRARQPDGPSTPVGAFDPTTGRFIKPEDVAQAELAEGVRQSLQRQPGEVQQTPQVRGIDPTADPGSRQVSPVDPRAVATPGFNPYEAHPLGPAYRGLESIPQYETARADTAEAAIRKYQSKYAPIDALAEDFMSRREEARNLSKAIRLARSMGADESLVQAIASGALPVEDFIEDVMDDEDARVKAEADERAAVADDNRRRALETEVLEPGRMERAEITARTQKAAEAGRMARHEPRADAEVVPQDAAEYAADLAGQGLSQSEIATEMIRGGYSLNVADKAASAVAPSAKELEAKDERRVQLAEQIGEPRDATEQIAFEAKASGKYTDTQIINKYYNQQVQAGVPKPEAAEAARRLKHYLVGRRYEQELED